MALAQQDYADITLYLKDPVSEWLPEDKLRDRSIIYEFEVREQCLLPPQASPLAPLLKERGTR
jgi:hypothetical protein